MADTTPGHATVPSTDTATEGDLPGLAERRDILVANNALPEYTYPANRPSPVATQLKLDSRPRELKSEKDLEDVISESRKHVNFSNFAEVSVPQHSARDPVFPTFTRFSSTRFANADTNRYTVEPSQSKFRNAVFDLKYPIVLHISDGQNMSVHGREEGIIDSSGYPLFFSGESPKSDIGSTGTLSLYPVVLSSYVKTRISPVLDRGIITHWTHMLSLSNEKESESILTNKITSASAGDNHIALLVKASLLYLDSAAAALDDVAMGRGGTAAASDHIININSRPGWLADVLRSPNQIVNVHGEDAGYQEFWAHCCFDEAPVYAVKSHGSTQTVTPFSRYKMNFRLKMLCVCDYDAYANSRTPAFFANPNAVLGYIETYVEKNHLQQQWNEALQIALLWPTLYHLGVKVNLPRPLHTTDWCGKELERGTIKSPYEGLISSNPFVVLASTLAAPWALHSQIYDYITLLASRRRDYKLTDTELQVCCTWLASRASRPGIGWDFLLRHQFHVTPSFFHLTGLSDTAVEWSRLLSNVPLVERQFPAHLRLLQPFRVDTSVCCTLPWENTWHPKLEFVPPSTLVATPGTIMTLLRLGLAESRSINGQGAIHGDGIYPIHKREGSETIRFPYLNSLQMQQIRQHGIKVVALCGPFADFTEGDVFTGRDPTDSSAARNQWSMGGLLENIATGERGGDAMLAEQHPYEPRSLVDPKCLEATSLRLAQTRDIIRQRALDAARRSGDKLAAQGAAFYKEIATFPSQEQQPAFSVPASSPWLNSGDSLAKTLVYSPQTSGDCGWWCVLFLLRMQTGIPWSMACLRQQIADLAGQETWSIGTLSVEEIAGICALLDVHVRKIQSQSITLLREDAAALASSSLPTSMTLTLHAQHWVVTKEGIEPCPPVNLSHLHSHLKGAGDRTLPGLNHSRLDLPRSNEGMHHNLATRARLLDEAVRRWDKGTQSTAEVIEIHRYLFPNAGIPRFLAVRLQDDALQTSEQSAARTSKSKSAVIIDFLNSHCLPSREGFLDTIKGAMKSLPQEECTRRWPHRARENANKNNLTAGDVLRFLDSEEPQEALALWFVWNAQGNHSEFVTSVGLWLACLDVCPRAWEELLASQLLDQNEDTWLSFAQGVHNVWRKHGLSRCSCSGCWSQLLYAPALFGRGGVVVDWAKEISNKASAPDDILAFTGTKWSAEFATYVIRTTIREVLHTACSRLRLLTFDDFMDHAYEWVVAGSAAGMPSAFRNTEVLRILRREYNISPRATKRSVMEAIPREHILAQLRSRPQIVAKLHQKLNETGGKARAIYGVTIWHYIFSNWLMAPFEKALDHENIDINIRNDRFLALQVRRAQDAKRGCFFSSYDYPDFNAMHSHYHMAIIYEEAGNIAKEVLDHSGMTIADRDLVMDGYKWLQDSVFTQVCYLAEADCLIQTVGGLFSGNRDTTLINTLLNVAYSRVVDISCRNLDLDPSVNWRLCHGDDIITQHEHYGAALAWNLVAARSNLRGKEEKLLTDRSFHEYLRIMGCADGNLRGSLARVVASFVNGNWETDYTPGAHGRVVELRSSIAVMQRRGMRAEVAPRLRRAVMQRLISQIAPDDEDGKQLRTILTEMLETASPAPKGLVRDAYASVGAPSQDGREMYTEAARREKLQVESLFLSLRAEITQPYMQSLLEMLPAELREQDQVVKRLRKILQKSTYGSELPSRFQIETKQTPQLLDLQAKLRTAEVKQNQLVRPMILSEASAIVGDRKTFASTIRRIKAFHVVLSALDDLAGYSKSELIAHLTNLPNSVVQNALLAEQYLQADWRRIARPSASEVAALENELEINLTADGIILSDEEVVLLADDGVEGYRPMRDIFLY